MRYVWLTCSCILALLATACSSVEANNADGAVPETTASSSSTTAQQDSSTTTAAEQAETETTAAAAQVQTETTTTSTTTTTTAAPTAPPCGLALAVVFDEGAPRDRLTISNASTSDVSFDSVRFDLSSSVGGIIFDTLDGGSGVEVFQDFQVEAGDAVLSAEPAAADGATELTLEFDSFEPDQSFTFSIDVDDQLTDSELGQIQVTGSELAGATVTVITTDQIDAVAEFGENDSAAFVSDC